MIKKKDLRWTEQDIIDMIEFERKVASGEIKCVPLNEALDELKRDKK